MWMPCDWLCRGFAGCGAAGEVVCVERTTTFTPPSSTTPFYHHSTVHLLSTSTTPTELASYC